MRLRSTAGVIGFAVALVVAVPHASLADPPPVPATIGTGGPLSGTAVGEVIATIRPGVVLSTSAGKQCSSNFVFSTYSGGRTAWYLGTAAHCFSHGSATQMDGCDTRFSIVQPSTSATVNIEGARHDGYLAYSSWQTMRDRGEWQNGPCLGNDFALVRIHDADVGRIDPTVPVYGGPTGIGGSSYNGDVVHTWLAAPANVADGALPVVPKVGVSLGQPTHPWYHWIYTATPGVFGESGAGYLDDDGYAFGVLSGLATSPFPGANAVTDLRLARIYARDHGGFGSLELVRGREPFRA